MRPTACMSSTSRKVGPRRALPWMKIGVAMCTNGSGTNSVKPPVSFCRSRVRTRWRATCTGRSTVPCMIVTFDRRPTLVRGAVRVEPLVGVDLVGADDRAHLVVEDLGRGAGQRREPGGLQPHQVLGERHLEPARAFGDFERGEAVDVDVGRDCLHRARDVDVVVAVEVGMDAALQAHLGRAALDRLDDAPLHLFELEEVRACPAGSARADPSRTRRTGT